MIEIGHTPTYRKAYRAARIERAKAVSDAFRWLFHRQ